MDTKVHGLETIAGPDGTQRTLTSLSFEFLFALSSCTEKPASQLALVVRRTVSLIAYAACVVFIGIFHIHLCHLRVARLIE